MPGQDHEKNDVLSSSSWEMVSDDSVTDKANEVGSTPHFCDLCAGMNFEALNSEDGYSPVPDVYELERRSDSCDLCKLLKLAVFETAGHGIEGKEVRCMTDAVPALESLFRDKGHNIRLSDLLILGLFPGGMFRPRRLHVGIVLPDRLLLPLSKKCRAMDISLGHVYLHGGKDPVPLRPRKKYGDLIWWLAERLWSRSFNPSRTEYIPVLDLPDPVLDLGEPDQQNSYLDDELRLIESDGTEGSYAELSYCWGAYRGFLTDRVSYYSRRAEIRFASLPPLFKDAV